MADMSVVLSYICDFPKKILPIEMLQSLLNRTENAKTGEKDLYYSTLVKSDSC